jgi:hypothetical protein
VKVDSDSFRKDGETIEFTRVSLTAKGRREGTAALDGVPIVPEAPPKPKKKKAKGKGSSADAARRAYFAKRARQRKSA